MFQLELASLSDDGNVMYATNTGEVVRSLPQSDIVEVQLVNGVVVKYNSLFDVVFHPVDCGENTWNPKYKAVVHKDADGRLTTLGYLDADDDETDPDMIRKAFELALKHNAHIYSIVFSKPDWEKGYLSIIEGKDGNVYVWFDSGDESKEWAVNIDTEEPLSKDDISFLLKA